MKNSPKWRRRLQLTRREPRALHELLRAGRTGLWVGMRGRAVLLAARGIAVAEIARQVGRDRKWVRLWLRRFARDRLAGLQDAARSGRPPKFSPRRAA